LGGGNLPVLPVQAKKARRTGVQEDRRTGESGAVVTPGLGETNSCSNTRV